MLVIGKEMGDTFARGLLHAAGVEGEALDLSGKLGGDRPTVMRVLVQFVEGGLTSLDVRNNGIGGDDASLLSTAVLNSTKIQMFNEISIKEMCADSFTELDLSKKHIGVEGGIVVAGLLPVMGGLTKMK